MAEESEKQNEQEVTQLLNDIHIAEKKNSLVVSMHQIIVNLSSTGLGQYTMRKLDKTLWIFENTAKWSLPQNFTNSESEKTLSAPQLIRPLPWILFIPALLTMRLSRAFISFFLLLLGRDIITAENIVNFFQISRRKMRAIKYQGLKINRSQLFKNQSIIKKNGIFAIIINLVRSILCANKCSVEPIEIVIKEKNKSSVKSQLLK